MKLPTIIQQVDKKKEELENLKPLKKEYQQKLDDKYRLEWNFHTNHIEGNTLTYGQTHMLLFFGKATGEHEKRQYDEMEAHDVAIKMIEEWAKDKNRDITEADLRQLNKIILVKPFWKEAITPEGQSTRKKVNPGEYKTTPNSVRLKDGQIHYYASPDETPILMQQLMEWYQKEKNLHPLLKAAQVHHRITIIHPFDDGNGRIARLWSNYILLRNGYSPLIVRTENKEKYLTSLQKADTGDIDPFIQFLAEELLWSINLSIKAAKGESVDEPGDLDKRIALLNKELDSDPKAEIKIHKNNVNLNELFINELYPLMKSLYITLKKFEKLFFSSECILTFGISDNKTQHTGPFERWKFPSAFNSIQLGKVKQIALTLRLKGFKKAGTKPFDISTEVWFYLDEYGYRAHYINEKEKFLIDKLYDQNVNDEEISIISEDFGNWILEQIELHRKKKN